MEFSEVLNNRRTYRDYSDREVSDEILYKVISAPLSKLRPTTICASFEFVVVRGREKHGKSHSTSCQKYGGVPKTSFSRLTIPATKTKWRCLPTPPFPKQQRMLMQSGLLIIPFYNQKTRSVASLGGTSSLITSHRAWCAHSKICSLPLPMKVLALSFISRGR